MKNPTKILILLLLLVSFGWVSAEELAVKVASDRNAVLHITDDKAGDPEVSGTIKGAANLKEGKSGLTADLVLKEAAELQGAEADFFAQVTGKTIEAVGFLNLKVPQEDDAPKKLDVNMTSVTQGDDSAANFKLDIQVPAKGEEVPKGSGSMSFKGDIKKATVNGDFQFEGPAIKGDQIPIKKFVLDINETGDKTSISFEVHAPKDSQAAGQMAMLPQLAPELENQLKRGNIKYEGLNFPAPATEGENTVGKGSVTLVGVRETLKPMLGMAAYGMDLGPDVDPQKAFEEMLQAKLDKLNITINFAATKMDGKMVMEGSGLDKFYSGYLTFMPAMNKIGQDELLREMGELRFILEPLLELHNEQTMASMELLLESSLAGEGQMKFNMEPKEGDIMITASGNMGVTGYSDYVKKARAKGLPAAEKAVVKFDMNLQDKTKLVGDMYLFTDGDIAHFYKDMLAKAAAKSNAPDDVKSVIESFNFEELAFKMTLKEQKLNIETKSKTSDLTPIAAVILKQAAPHLEMDVTGAAVDLNMEDGGKGKADVKVFFSNFLPGKNEAQIKEALGLPGSAKVTMEAPAGDVALAAAPEPALALEGKLADVQKEGKALMDVSPAAVAAGATEGGGGGSKTGLIVLGLLLLVGVGGFLAFGNKS